MRAEMMMIKPGTYLSIVRLTGLSLVLLFVSSFKALTQQNDFQAWPSLQVNVEVLDNIKLHVEEEVRFHENLSQVARQINDLGVSYRFNKHLRAGIFYRIEADWKNADEYSWRNGIYSDISLRTELSRFSFGYRLRFQSSKVERNDNESALFNGFRHRHKISAEYDLKGIPLVPFLDAELFVDYTKENHSMIRGFRTWAGLDYTINKIHTVTIKYGIDQEINSNDPIKAFIVALGYAIDLRLNSSK